MRLYCTAEVKPEEIMTRKDKDKDKGRTDSSQRIVSKMQKDKMTKHEIIRGTTHFTKARLNLNF